MQKEIDKMTNNAVKKLRGYIKGEISRNNQVSLVLVIGTFDAREHAIPTVEELNMAISELYVCIERIEDDIIILERKNQKNCYVQINDNDLDFLYQNYLKLIRKK